MSKRHEEILIEQLEDIKKQRDEAIVELEKLKVRISKVFECKNEACEYLSAPFETVYREGTLPRERFRYKASGSLKSLLKEQDGWRQDADFSDDIAWDVHQLTEHIARRAAEVIERLEAFIVYGVPFETPDQPPLYSSHFFNFTANDAE